MTMRDAASILVVDDTPENLRLLMDMLSGQGYRVRSAPNGKRALASVTKAAPDLILLDIQMPEMNGYEVCRQLKQDDWLKDIPVIFISALSEVFDKVTAFQVGGVDYITKPFQIEEVLARVTTHLRMRQMQRSLQEQNLELEAFAHTVAHDLKSPLSTVIASLDWVMTRPDTAAVLDENVEKLLELGLNSSHKMRSIIDELLLLASVRKQDVQFSPVNMDRVVDHALGRIEFLVREYQPEIHLPAAWPEVVSYAPWIEEVWVNYLSNGLKYGGLPPRVELGANRPDRGMIRFWVRDNGEGLDEESQAKLFTEFTRMDEVRAQGHGLGLSIVQRIVNKLGGRVGVDSQPGQGSEFYFMLPFDG